MKQVKNLRKHFRAALALTGQTQDSWAKAHAIAPSVLSMVLSGKRENAAILEKIEAFTTKHGAAVVEAA